MANISDAIGTIRFTAPNKDTIKSLLFLIEKYLGGVDYATSISKKDDNKSVIQNIDWDTLEKNEKPYYTNFSNAERCILEAPFYGYGRWCFESNIKKMFTWISNEKLSELDKRVIEYLEEKSFEIEFSYVDFEPGCCVFCEETVTLIHRAGTSLKDARSFSSSYKEIEDNLVNLIVYNYASNLFEAYEYRYGFPEDDLSYFLEQINYNKEVIEAYFGKELEEVLKENNMLDFYKQALVEEFEKYN